MQGLCTYDSVVNGTVGPIELAKMNALLDMKECYEAYASEDSKR